MYSSISSTSTTTTKQKIHAPDSERCLITFEKMPTASQQVVHMMSRLKISKRELKVIQVMWRVPRPLNLDSMENLVTLRADWYFSFEQGDWALVPAEYLLRKILESDASTFDEPYPEFDPEQLHDYVFVPLPTLRQHYILRQMTKFDEDEDHSESESDDEDQDVGESEDEGEDEVEDDGKNVDGEAGNEDKRDMVDIENGNAIVHIKPFSGFPLLKHHAHPFFVIYNALPKLRSHLRLLRSEHNDLLNLMTEIEAIWLLRMYEAPTSSKLNKRRRSSDDAHDDRPKRKTRGTANLKCGNSELPHADRTKTRETRRRTDAGKGKGRAKGLGEKTPAQRDPSPSSTLQSSTERPKDFLFDDTSEVTAWSTAVAAAGTPDDMDDTVVWSDEERVRPPIKNWDRWRDPYKQPKQRARFCSSDWPMYFYSLALWTPRPYPK